MKGLHCDVLISFRITDLSDPEDRMLAVLEWYLTSFHAGRQVGFYIWTSIKYFCNYGICIQGYSYFSEVEAMGLLNLRKKAFGPSKLEKFNAVKKNWTAILNGLQIIKEIRSVKL